MTTDKQALREAAEKAGKDEWQARKINGDFYVIRSGSYKKQYGITLYQSVAEIDDKAVRDFVAMANPAAVLALLDENIQLRREKDATEAVLSAMRDDMRQAREQLKAAEHTAAVDHEAACSLVAENEELKRRIAELEIESSVKDAAIIELRQQYSRLQEARYDTKAVRVVIAERLRQQSVEGWTPEHDDEYDGGELAGAAVCYARHVSVRGWVYAENPAAYQDEDVPGDWPWAEEWWKPTSPYRDLEKAGALILAEMERINRATGAGEGGTVVGEVSRG
ncbi:TPA: ead/Ea22-like family protein [Salmonella enterica subsp. diarizonae serovar 50:k:z35]|uniref:ead/Ea22-like family protein n=1 Tax=Salmonella enterica TaxID=28901 RepID=UPI001CF5DDB7